MPKGKFTHQTEFKQEPGLGLVPVVPTTWAHRPVRFEFDGEVYKIMQLRIKEWQKLGFRSLVSGGYIEIELYEDSKQKL